ncbi:MAG TPA: methylenetetrahydrofolate reductase [NAD(P)H] [Candidatus Copromorpha excrementigallinarum]|uniref:Methylenetetrahydrofolate reductase n=1 Tax=Candidatus Allocopromorpha excrementigallinarum TaxID=2840742 RepID=A0A9D1I301_9FIRM|nr:methylenetetrahydrofolate reductase [NAD(P)H] [Candidatus Copromorpha excrementigallinarum]
MRIPELYEKKKPVFSLEIFPPKRKSNLEGIYKTVERLADCKPDFISVTYGAGGNIADNSTCEIASNIKKNYGIETVAHLTCVNSTKEDVKEMIGRFADADIQNVLALRGDIVEGEELKHEFRHANELAIEVQRKCNDDIEILGACYPEGHYESRSLDEDINNLKYKIGAGVKVLITQLFFDNQAFYEFIGKARLMGIAVPVSAGIMPIVTSKQIEKTVALSGASLPHDFTKMISLYENDAEGLFEAGINYAVGQIRDLITNGVDGIHVYTMNNPEVALRVYEEIKDLL